MTRFSRAMWAVPLLVLWAAAGLLQAGVEAEDRMNKSIPVKPGGRLTLEAEYGSIAVEPADVQAVQVEVYRKVEAPTREENERILKDFDLQVTQTGNDVTLRGVFKEGWRPSSEVSGHRRRICQDNKCLTYAEYLRTHHYKIAVPREFSVDLATRAGSVGVGDLKGEARARTSGGSLNFGRIAGPVWGRTSGGSISLAGGSGPAEVRTSGGSVHIGEVSGQVVAHTSGGSIHIERATGTVSATTSGGGIEVREVMAAIEAQTSGGSVTAYLSAQPQGPCRLSTSGGNVNIYLADALKVDLDAHTSSGRVTTDFPVTLRGVISPHELKAPINGGGPLLHLRTSGGSIHVRKGSGRAERTV